MKHAQRNRGTAVDVNWHRVERNSTL